MVINMDVNERLRQMLNEQRNTVPSISTLQAICNGFGITLSQFFAEGEMVEMTPELKELFNGWVNLNPEQKAAVQQIIKAMKSK